MKSIKYLIIFLIVFSGYTFSQNSTFNEVGFWQKSYAAPLISVEVDSSNAYIGRGKQFEIINTENPNKYTLITSYTLPSDITKIINIKDPDQNKIYSIIECNTNGNSKNGIYILDVTDPGNIKEIFNKPLNTIKDFVVTNDDSIIYVIASDKLVRINIGDITNPVITSTSNISGELINTESNYLIIENAEKLNIFNMDSVFIKSTPVSSYQPICSAPGTCTASLGYFTVYNNNVYLTCGFSGETLGKYYSWSELEQIDLSQIEKPNIVYTNDHQSWKDAVIKNDTAYAISSDNKLQIIDLNSNALVSEYSNLQNPHQIKVKNQNIFIADDYNGLQVLDISSVKAPKLKANYPVLQSESPAVGLLVYGNYCYMIDLIGENSTAGMRILDVSNKQNPKTTGFYNLNESGVSKAKMFIYENYLYTITPHNFYVFDITNRNKPSIIDSTYFSSTISGEKRFNDKLYLLQNTENNLIRYDLTNPSKPSFIDSVSVLPAATNIDVEDSLLVVSKYNQFEFLNLKTASENPAPLFWYDFHGYIRDIHLHYPTLSIVATNGYEIQNNNNGLFNYTIDINGKTLVPKGQFISANNDASYYMLVKDSLCFLHNNTTGIYLINNSDISNPSEISRFNKPSGLIALDNNNVLYVVKPGEGLYILTNDLITDVNENKITDSRPNSYDLFQNYPNPFNPSTIIKYSIPKEENVTLKIYDVLGREIKTLVNEAKPAGNYEVEFDGSNLSSGIYFYQIQTGDYTETKKMLLLK